MVDAAVLCPRGAADAERAGLVSLAEVIPDAILDIRYYTAFNFVGERIDGYEAPAAYLTRAAADALRCVSDDLRAAGYRIKIFDAYRPTSAVAHFVRWAEDLDAVGMKPYFYPGVDKADLFAKGYIAQKSSHSRGSTVDLTLVDAASGREVDMGCPFDYFGAISHIDSKEGLTPAQIENRRILHRAMTKNGFLPLPEEWWHFTLADEPYPNTYFGFPVTAPRGTGARQSPAKEDML